MAHILGILAIQHGFVVKTCRIRGFGARFGLLCRRTLWQPHSIGVKWKLQVSTCPGQSYFGAMTTFQGGIGCQGGEIWASEMVQAWFFQY